MLNVVYVKQFTNEMLLVQWKTFLAYKYKMWVFIALNVTVISLWFLVDYSFCLTTNADVELSSLLAIKGIGCTWFISGTDTYYFPLPTIVIKVQDGQFNCYLWFSLYKSDTSIH